MSIKSLKEEQKNSGIAHQYKEIGKSEEKEPDIQNSNIQTSMINLRDKIKKKLSLWLRDQALIQPDFSSEKKREYEEKNSILEGKITNFLVVGNGFDIACNAKTSFKNFLFFVVAASLIIKYVKAKNIEIFEQFLYGHLFSSTLTEVLENLREDPGKIDFLEKLLKDFCSNQFCLNILCNVFPSVTDSKNEEFDWIENNFESDAINNFSYFIDKAHNEFSVDWNDDNSIQNRIFKLLKQDETRDNQYDNWLDVERFIKKMVTESNIENESVMSRVNSNQAYKKWSFPSLIDYPNEISTCYKGIIVFLDTFKFYLTNEMKIVYRKNNKENIRTFFETLSNKHLYSLRNRSSYFIDSIKLPLMDYLINYNYTDIADNFLVSSMLDLEKTDFRMNDNFSKVKSKYKHMFHINGAINSMNVVKNSMVLGYYNGTDSSQSYIKKNTKLYPFEKIYQRVIKNVPFLDLEGIIAQNYLYDVIFYGHSCSDTDGDLIKKILEDDRLHIAIILCLNMQSMMDCFTNIASIVSKDKLNNLLSREQDKYKNFLFFSIEGEEIILAK